MITGESVIMNVIANPNTGISTRQAAMQPAHIAKQDALFGKLDLSSIPEI